MAEQKRTVVVINSRSREKAEKLHREGGETDEWEVLWHLSQIGIRENDYDIQIVNEEGKLLYSDLTILRNNLMVGIDPRCL